MHVNKQADIAPVVLIAGDPRRSKWAAEKLLENAVLVSEIRNAFVYTGTYKGNKVSFATSGMGQASIAIYATELFKDHDVKRMVRVGTCGTYRNDISVGTVVEAKESSVEVDIFAPEISGWRKNEPTYNLGLGVPVNVHCSDVFYRTTPLDPIKQKLDVVDMESYALFYIAQQYNREAATVLTVTDNLNDHSNDMKPEDRELSTLNMYKAVLDKAFA